MNKGRIYTLLLLLLAVGMPLSSAPRKKKSAAPQSTPHYIDLHAGAGYTSHLHPTDGAVIPGGGGFIAGAGYECHLQNWLFNVGAEFQFHNSTSLMPDAFHEAAYLYTPIANHILTYGCDATHIRTTLNSGLVTLPLSVGYKFAERYYVMAGLRVGMGVFGTSHTRADLHVSVTDPEFADPMDDIGHMTGTSQYDEQSRWQVGWHLAPAVELGMYVAPAWRLGLFAEYGVLNVDKEQQIASEVHPLFAGLRCTALIAVGKAPNKKPAKPAKPVKPAASKPQPKPTPQPQEPPVEVEDTIRYGDIEIIKEQPLVLENLMFAFGTSDIIPESTGTLDQLLSLMLERKELRIHITGHTDNVGTDAYNKRLSVDRAKAVCDYLREHGVKADRMTYSGEGATKPIDTNETERGRQRNRRVEITVVNQ